MQRRRLPTVIDHGSAPGAFATKWEGRKNPQYRNLESTRGRINVAHPDDIDRIENAMGIYLVLYEASPGTRYVLYIGYSKVLGTELKIRYGKWESAGRMDARPSSYPFAALYISSQRAARDYEDDLIRYYAPPWNTKFHR